MREMFEDKISEGVKWKRRETREARELARDFSGWPGSFQGID